MNLNRTQTHPPHRRGLPRGDRASMRPTGRCRLMTTRTHRGTDRLNIIIQNNSSTISLQGRSIQRHNKRQMRSLTSIRNRHRRQCHDHTQSNPRRSIKRTLVSRLTSLIARSPNARNNSTTRSTPINTPRLRTRTRRSSNMTHIRNRRSRIRHRLY